MSESGETGRGGARDWREIRRLYEETAMSVAAIRERFGLSIHELRRRRVAEGWEKRPAAVERLPLAQCSPVRPPQVRERLLRLVHDGLKAFGEGEAYDPDHARALLTLARTWTVMHRAQTRSRRTRTAAPAHKPAGEVTENKNNNGGPDPDNDIDLLRAEIARRIVRIREEAGLEGASAGVGG